MALSGVRFALPTILLVFALQDRAAAAPGQERWHFHTGGTIYGTPAIGTNDVVYVGSGDGKLYALDGTGGQMKWSFQTADLVGAAPSVAEDGTVYVASLDGRVTALDPANGHVKWQRAWAPIKSCPAISPDGTLYFTPFNSRIALSGATGATKWWIYDPTSSAMSSSIGDRR